MPSVFTHFLIARSAMEKLNGSEKLKNDAHFLLGSQGPDLAFFYPSRKKPNLGRALHTQNVYSSLCALASSYSSYPESARRFTLGYITHYAADVVFHPYIYHLSNKFEYLPYARLHVRIENDLDSYFLEKYSKDGIVKEFIEGKINYQSLFLPFSDMSKAIGWGGLSRKKLSFSFKAFRAYSSFFDERANKVGNFVRTVEKPFGKAQLSCLFHRDKIEEEFLNRENEMWCNPACADEASIEDCDMLFSRAADESVKLLEEFLFCANSGENLDKAMFSRHFLKGI